MDEISYKIKAIKLLLTDCDGVLTDGGVYYSATGEELKKFNLRDGMGVERLRNICSIDTGIITGENSPIVARRAEKLKIVQLHLGIKDKSSLLTQILEDNNLKEEEIAYIGDDMNDLEVIERVGVSASPADGFPLIKQKVNYICEAKGGEGAFREFVEWIIAHRTVK